MGLPGERGTAQLNGPLPARGMPIAFTIGDDSRHNRGRWHGPGLLEGLAAGKDKALRDANALAAAPNAGLLRKHPALIH